mgnify:CR=1 FL=1
MRRINHNDLAPWFLEDHGQLPASYLESCRKFFSELRATSSKRQATSSPQLKRIHETRKDNYENK